MSEADKIIKSLRDSGKKVEEFYMSNKTSDKNVADIEKYIKNIKQYINLVLDKGYCDCNELNVISMGKYCDGSKNVAYSMQNILAELEQKDKKIRELEEYISIAPNLDEMTATKYINIQREAYIRGKAEEQQRAEQIIYENYIPKQVVIETLNKHKFAYEELSKMYNNTHYEDDEIRARDFYVKVTEDSIVQVLTKLLGGEK